MVPSYDPLHPLLNLGEPPEHGCKDLCVTIHHLPLFGGKATGHTYYVRGGILLRGSATAKGINGEGT